MKLFSSMFIVFLLVNSLNAQQITGTTKMHNLLYHDVPNTIYFKDIDLEKYKISISNGEILEVKKSVLTVLIDSEYKTTIKLERKNVVKELSFRVIPFPKPKIAVRTNGDGDFNNMTLEEFISMKTAYAILENFSVDCSLTVESCEVLKISPDGKRDTIYLHGSSFDSLRLKKGAKKGDVYIFTNIRVRILHTNRIVNATEFTIYLR